MAFHVRPQRGPTYKTKLKLAEYHKDDIIRKYNKGVKLTTMRIKYGITVDVLELKLKEWRIIND